MMLSPETFPVPLICISETSSTNSYLNSICSKQKTDEFTTVLADFQTAGRGQRGNSWESEEKRNLLFSFVLYPDFLEAKRQFLISQIVSLAVKEELEYYTSDITIKWPNDIYWRDKKICGMLIENELMGKNISQSITGIGININQSSFHSSAPNPVSIRQITGKEHDLKEILSRLMERVKAYYELLRQGQHELIASRYGQALYRKKGFHPYKDAGGEFSAEIIKIESDGRLILKDDKGRERGYLFKEVEYLPDNRSLF